MDKVKLKGKDLRKINYSSNQVISLAIDIMAKHYKHATKEEQLEKLTHIKEHHEEYLNAGKSLLKKKYYLSGVNELFVQKNGRFKMHSKILPGLY